MIGELIAHYRVTAKLGEGDMGEVHRVTNMKLDREVTIKILPKVSLMIQEVGALRR
jgi:serine/threonine protein kinase